MTLQTTRLDGEWKLRWTDGHRWGGRHAGRPDPDEARYLPAQVPGEVHLDLMRAGVLAEPAVAMNHLAARWVETCMWTYRRVFEVTTEAREGRCWLVFERLDLEAEIRLNGEVIGRHSNSFHPCRLEVTGKLAAGENILVVHLNAGLHLASDKPAKGFERRPGDLVAKRHWLRKPQCQFGWDWAPWMLNVGISGSVRLEWTHEAVRVEAWVPLVTVAEDLANATVEVRAVVEGLTSEPVKAVLRACMPETGEAVESEIEVKPGRQTHACVLPVSRPELWWPVGQGEARLYTLRLSLAAGESVLAETEKQIGFRRVRVIQERHPEQGAYFVFEINNRKVFLKGGNFVPADIIFARIDRERYEVLTDRALESNMNFLRVWGGGQYEADDFYGICDRKGIVVWQEFIFACLRYPLQDEAFYRSVREEAVYQVRRLAEHPSLIAWCGNNEMEEGSWHWGFDRGEVLPDHALFHLVLPRIMAEEDPTRFYWPSSPYSGPGLDPRLPEIGDQHPWSLGFVDTDFRKYREMICRFANEGGFLGPTALPTMRACLEPGKETYKSLSWQLHDNAIEGFGENPSFQEKFVEDWLGKALETLSIEENTYWVGLLQGEALREYIENFRRRMFDSACAAFWMYNDAWPATRTWTVVDYYLRRTPAFWPVRRAMRPVALVLTREETAEGAFVRIYGVNDTQDEICGRLSYGLFALAGGRPLEREAEVVLAPNASTRLAEFGVEAWADPARSMAFARLLNGAGEVARNRLFLPRFREMEWPEAKVRVSLDAAAGEAVFESEAFAWGICLDLDGETALEDNFFDVWPGIPYRIPWPGGTPPQILRIGNLQNSE